MLTPSSMLRAAPLDWVQHRGREIALDRRRPNWSVLNETAAWIVRYCDGSDGRAPAEIASAFRTAFGPASDEDVHAWVQELCAAGLLEPATDRNRSDGAHLELESDFAAYRIEHVYLELLARCNLRCTHCYMNGAPEREESLAPELVEGVLEEFRRLGGSYVTLSGGEPTIYPAFERIARRAADLGLRGTVITNGVSLRDRHLELLRELDFSLAVSIDGATEATNDGIRGAGSFRAAVRAFERSTAALDPERVVLSFTPVRSNHHELPGVLRFAERLGIRRVNVSVFEEVGRAVRHGADLELGDEDRARIVGVIHSEALRLIGRMEIDLNDTRNVLARFALGTQPGDLHPLWRGVRVDSSGRVYPSSFSCAERFYLGSVHESPLQAIFASEVLRDLHQALRERYRRIPRCSACPWGRICRGGSATSAYYSSGDLYEPDAYCSAYLQHFPEVVVQLAAQEEAAGT